MAPNLDGEKGQVNEGFTMDELDAKKRLEESTTASTISSVDDDKKSKKKKNKKKKGEEDDKNKPTLPGLAPVPFFSLFRFASGSDIFLIVVAALAAAGTGVMFPLMMILFGDLTDAFVGQGYDSNFIHELQ